jgi:hypothetical protein
MHASTRRARSNFTPSFHGMKKQNRKKNRPAERRGGGGKGRSIYQRLLVAFGDGPFFQELMCF